MSGRPCYEVCFSDGQTIIADAAHLWRTTTKSARKHGRPSGIVTTAEIASTLRAGAEWNHHVELARAAQYPELSLPIDPYVLGVWLGDGTSSSAEVTVGHGDEQTLDEIRAAGGRFKADGSLSSVLRRMRLFSDEFVPVSI